MNRYVVGTLVTVAALLIGVLVLFGVQNSSRVTQLSLNLGFYAAELQNPVSVVYLIFGSFGGGLLVSFLAFFPGSMRAKSEARKLKQELALAGGSSSDGWKS